jgi:hypothetical protein
LAAILAGAAVYVAVLGLAGVRPRHLMEPPASRPGHSATV